VSCYTALSSHRRPPSVLALDTSASPRQGHASVCQGGGRERERGREKEGEGGGRTTGGGRARGWRTWAVSRGRGVVWFPDGMHCPPVPSTRVFVCGCVGVAARQRGAGDDAESFTDQRSTEQTHTPSATMMLQTATLTFHTACCAGQASRARGGSARQRRGGRRISGA
jgi:hypothetical protein